MPYPLPSRCSIVVALWQLGDFYGGQPFFVLGKKSYFFFPFAGKYAPAQAQHGFQSFFTEPKIPLQS